MLDISLIGGDSGSPIRLTRCETSFSYSGHVYQPFHFTRSQIDERLVTNSGDVPAVTVNVTNADKQLGSLLSSVEVEGSQAILRQTDRQLIGNLRDSDAMILARGEIRDCVLSDNNFTFRIVTVIGQNSRITIPLRVFQSNCNYLFGGASCGVDISASPISIQSTVSGCTNKRIDVPLAVYFAAGSPADPSDYWATGYVIMKNGVCALQSRPIQRVENTGTHLRLWLRTGFMVTPNVGDGLVIKRNCRRTPTDCQTYQGNLLQFGGFPNVPPQRFTPDQIKRGVNIS